MIHHFWTGSTWKNVCSFHPGNKFNYMIFFLYLLFLCSFVFPPNVLILPTNNTTFSHLLPAFSWTLYEWPFLIWVNSGNLLFITRQAPSFCFKSYYYFCWKQKKTTKKRSRRITIEQEGKKLCYPSSFIWDVNSFFNTFATNIK